VAKYFVQVGYTAEAWAAMSRGPHRVVERVQASAEALGGSIESLFFCFGDYDLVGIVDFPGQPGRCGVVHGREQRGRRARLQDHDAAVHRGGPARPRSGLGGHPHTAAAQRADLTNLRLSTVDDTSGRLRRAATEVARVS